MKPLIAAAFAALAAAAHAQTFGVTLRTQNGGAPVERIRVETGVAVGQVLFTNAFLTIDNQQTLQFREAGGANFAALRAPAALGADYTLTLPADDGAANQVLTTDGAGLLSWSTPVAYSAGAGLSLAGTVFSTNLAADDGVTNEPGDLVNWNEITNMPAGFADNTDNDTTYLAGNQLSLAGSTFNVTEGAGSGLDADLLDGLSSTDFLRRNAADTSTAAAPAAYLYSFTNSDAAGSGGLSVNSTAGTGVRGQGGTYGVYGTVTTGPGTGDFAVYGWNTSAAAGTHVGTYGAAIGAGTVNWGVYGAANVATVSNYGVYGRASGSVAAAENRGVYAQADGAGAAVNYGIYATATGAATNWAGFFADNVRVGDGGGTDRLSFGASGLLQIGTFTAAAPLTGDMRYNAGNLEYYNGAWQTLAVGGGGVTSYNGLTGAVTGVSTINGIAPTAAGNFTLTAGTAVSIVPGANSVTINNTGVTSVTASAPLASSGGSTPNLSLTGIVPIANGGTNTGAIGAAGTSVYSTGAAYGFSAVGVAGQILHSGGAGAPTWSAVNLASATETTGLLPVLRGGTGANLSATGGASQYVKQLGVGAAFSVGAIAAADLPAGSGNYIQNQIAVAQAAQHYVTSADATRTARVDNSNGAGDGLWGVNTAAAGAGTGAGLYGLSAQSGAGSAGVYGQNSNAAGVGVVAVNTAASGASTGIGVAGQSSQSGGRGIEGANFNAGGIGIGGFNSAAAGAGTGIGMFGRSDQSAGFGVEGYNGNASGTGVLGIGNAAAGSYLVAGSGAAFTGTITGSFNYSTTAGAGEALYTNQFGTICRVNYWSGATQYKILGTGAVSTIVKDLKGDAVVLHAPEAPEVYFMDCGTGVLKNGKAHVDLDPILAKNIAVDDAHPLRVFVQLEDNVACKGVIVKAKSAKGFDVEELGGGASDTPFVWQVVANRADETLDNGHEAKYRDLRFERAPKDRDLSPARADAPAAPAPLVRP